MTFTNEISISDITSALSVAFVILGGIFGYYQWRKNVLLKRAGYINDLTEKIRTDSDIKDVIYMFDYGEEWYSAKFHGSGELELKVDKTLSYFSYICYLKKQKIRYNLRRNLGSNRQLRIYLLIKRLVPFGSSRFCLHYSLPLPLLREGWFYPPQQPELCFCHAVVFHAVR